MYKNLLLSNKGGIIDEINRSDQDNCAVVAIGLGGTGCDCLRNLKAKIYNRVKPDDPDASVPKYGHIKFWAVDTDKEGFRKSNDEHSSIDKIDMDTEFFDLSYSGDINAVFEQMSGKLENSGEYKEWLRHKDIRVAAAKAGACGVRQIGRYLLMEKASDFMSKISNSITEAKKGLINPKVYIHIFSGLGGGTGAGTFLDVCYLVQKALGSQGTNAFVCGYFFLPDVNLAKQLDDETSKYVRINGYASLQDLDYCMNFERNTDKWSQRYPGVGLIENPKPPVDICHLISGHDSNGNVIPDAYDYAMNVVTDYFMDFLIKSEGEFTMESHIANYMARKAMLNKTSGANYEYCILGAANATLPYKEILTYLASYLLGSFANMSSVVAKQVDVDEFVRSNGLGYAQLFNMLQYGANLTFPEPDNNHKDAYENDDLVTKYFADLRAAAVGKFEANLSAMEKDINSYDPTNSDGASAGGTTTVHATSIITKIFHSLFTIMSDPTKGPYMASSLINGTSSSNLVAVVDGHIAEAKSKIAQLEHNLPDFESRRKLKQDNFFGAGHASRGKYREYVATTRSLIIEYTRRELLYKMLQFLNTLRKQLVDLSSKYYKVYCSVMTELSETFYANKSYLEDISDKISEFEYPITTINELKPTLNQYLTDQTKFDIYAQMRNFQYRMLSTEGHKAWTSSNKDDVCKFVSKYFSGVFSEYTTRGMTEYLKDKYNTDDTNALIQKIREDIMTKLDQKANPLYWSSSSYSVGNASKIGYTTVPIECQEVRQAAENLGLASPELKVRPSDVKDRITIMRCLVGTPLYGYQPLSQYEQASIADNEIIGKHLYEGKVYTDDNGNVVAGRDWRRLPSPTPKSLMNSNNAQDLLDIAKSREKLYTDATDSGIIIKDAADSYFVRIIDEGFMAEIRAMAEDAVKSGDKGVMFKTREKIMEMKTAPKYSDVKISIPNDAKNGDSDVTEALKKEVRIDHFAAMPLVCKAVENEVEKLAAIDKIAADLEPKVDHDFEDYANALFTGAITIEGIKIYCTDKFSTEVVLSSPDMPRGGIRLYQAFLSFKDLSSENRALIKKTADSRNSLAEGMECLVKGCKNVKAQLEKKDKQLNTAKEKFTSESDTIFEFFRDLETELDEYMDKYDIQ